MLPGDARCLTGLSRKGICVMRVAASPWPAQLSVPINTVGCAPCAAQRASHSLAAAAAARPSYTDADDFQERRRKSRRHQQRSDSDDDFMDPHEAAQLRRQLKNQSRSPTAGTDGITPSVVIANTQQQHQSISDNSNSSSSTKQRLFSTSQLQPAAPGSSGTIPALPIVRPAADASKSTSSPFRSSSTAQSFFSSTSWEALGVSADTAKALNSLGFNRPSHVQAEAYKALGLKSGFKHVAVADQAGSGKTLAYLLPLLQQLKQKEAVQGGPVTTPHSPSLIVMTPTTELAQQVYRVVRALSGAGLRVRSAVMTGGQSETDRRSKTFRTQCDLLSEGIDVLIATPGRLTAHIEKGSLRLDTTAALVLDEVDVLAGEDVSYSQHIAPLRAAAGPDMRCVLVSATLPQHTFDQLQELFPGLGVAFGPGLHRTASGVLEELIDCSGGEEISLESGTQRKLEALVESLARYKSSRTIIFCNKIETCRVVENALRRQRGDGVCQVLAYHEAIREDLRAAALSNWLAAPTSSQPPKVLVCTDRTSRGIDSMWCEHVVLFEFPRDPSEYVRRVGRTARGAGGRGVVTVLVLGKQVALAKSVLERSRAGAPVHRLPRVWETER